MSLRAGRELTEHEKAELQALSNDCFDALCRLVESLEYQRGESPPDVVVTPEEQELRFREAQSCCIRAFSLGDDEDGANHGPE